MKQSVDENGEPHNRFSSRNTSQNPLSSRHASDKMGDESDRDVKPASFSPSSNVHRDSPAASAARLTERSSRTYRPTAVPSSFEGTHWKRPSYPSFGSTDLIIYRGGGSTSRFNKSLALSQSVMETVIHLLYWTFGEGLAAVISHYMYNPAITRAIGSHTLPSSPRRPCLGLYPLPTLFIENTIFGGAEAFIDPLLPDLDL